MIASSCASKRSCRSVSSRISAPVQAVHGFLHKVAGAVGIETIAPPDARAGRLTEDFRLVEDGQRYDPAGVLQRDEAAAPCLAVGQRGDFIDELGPCVGDREGHPERVGYPGCAKENVGIAEIYAPSRQPLPQRPRPSGRPRGRRRAHRSRGKVGGLRAGGHEHDIVRRDRNRRRGAVPFIIEPVHGDAAR